jgi:hypothetical protein
MAEALIWFFFIVQVVPAVCFIQAIISVELEKRRHQHEWEQLQGLQVEIRRAREAQQKSRPKPAIQVRGYDTPQLFRDDALTGFSGLRETEEYVRELEKDHSSP